MRATGVFIVRDRKTCMKWLFLGAKEYPFGAGAFDDPLPSGGYEKYAEQLADAFAHAGDEVHLVTRRFRKPAKAAAYNARIHVHNVPWIPGKLMRNPTFNAAALLKAARLDFDIILAQGLFATMAGIALEKIKNRPLISMPAGIAYSQPQHGAWLSHGLKRLESETYRHADAVVFLSEQEREQFQTKLGFLPKHNTVIPPGVAIPKGNETQEGRKTKSGKTQKNKAEGPQNQKKKTPLQLLSVGRLIGVKGLQFLLPAMKDLDAHLTIVGNGPQEAELKSLARRLGLKNVTFAGFHADPVPFYERADAFVLPSLSEGLPMAALEAAAHGLALVVTDIGLPFENKKTALVVPPSDTAGLASAINKLEKQPTLRQELGQNARTFVAKTYSWKKTATELDELAAKL